jgi:hypothetical protein
VVPHLARVRAASREPADISRARSDLEAAVAEAERRHMVRAALTIRLALGDIELQSPATVTSGVGRLRALERDARARGFGLIANQAARSARVISSSRN